MRSSISAVFVVAACTAPQAPPTGILFGAALQACWLAPQNAIASLSPAQLATGKIDSTVSCYPSGTATISGTFTYVRHFDVLVTLDACGTASGLLRCSWLQLGDNNQWAGSLDAHDVDRDWSCTIAITDDVYPDGALDGKYAGTICDEPFTHDDGNPG